MEATTASATTGKTVQDRRKSRIGYLPIPPVGNEEDWNEIKQILMEAEPAGLTVLHQLIHSVMKEKNIPIPIIDGK